MPAPGGGSAWRIQGLYKAVGCLYKDLPPSCPHIAQCHPARRSLSARHSLLLTIGIDSNRTVCGHGPRRGRAAAAARLLLWHCRGFSVSPLPLGTAAFRTGLHHGSASRKNARQVLVLAFCCAGTQAAVGCAARAISHDGEPIARGRSRQPEPSHGSCQLCFAAAQS